MSQITQGIAGIPKNEMASRVISFALALSNSMKLDRFVIKLPNLAAIETLHADLKTRLESGWVASYEQLKTIRSLIRDRLIAKGTFSFQDLTQNITVRLFFVSGAQFLNTVVNLFILRSTP